MDKNPPLPGILEPLVTPRADTPLPPHNGTKTSKEAAESMRGRAGTLRQKVLLAIRNSPSGLTCDACEELLSLSHQTCSARFSELRQKGFIVNINNEVRKTRSNRNAAVWREAT